MEQMNIDSGDIFENSRTFLSCMENNWEERVKTFKDLATYIKSDTLEKIECLERYNATKSVISLQLTDLRSSVVKEISISLCEVINYFGITFEESIDDQLMEILFKLLVNSKEVFSKSADQCLQQMLQSLPQSQKLFDYFKKQTSNKSNQLRAKIFEYFNQYFTTNPFPSNILCSNNENSFEAIIKSGFADAFEPVRNKSKFLLFHYSFYFPEKAQEIYSKLPKAKQTTVIGSLSSLPLPLTTSPLFLSLSSSSSSSSISEKENAQNGKIAAKPKPWLTKSSSLSLSQPNSSRQPLRSSSFQIEIAQNNPVEENLLSKSRKRFPFFAFGLEKEPIEIREENKAVNDLLDRFSVGNFSGDFFELFQTKTNVENNTKIDLPSFNFDQYLNCFENILMINEKEIHLQYCDQKIIISINEMKYLINLFTTKLFSNNINQIEKNFLIKTLISFFSLFIRSNQQKIAIEILVGNNQSNDHFQIGLLPYLVIEKDDQSIGKLFEESPNIVISGSMRLINLFYSFILKAKNSNFLFDFLVVFNRNFDLMQNMIGEWSSLSMIDFNDQKKSYFVMRSEKDDQMEEIFGPFLFFDHLMKSLIKMKEISFNFQFLSKKIENFLHYLNENFPIIVLSIYFTKFDQQNEKTFSEIKKQFQTINLNEKTIDFYYQHRFLPEISKITEATVEAEEIPLRSLSSIFSDFQSNYQEKKFDIGFIINFMHKIIFFSKYEKSSEWFSIYAKFLNISCDILNNFYSFFNQKNIQTQVFNCDDQMVGDDIQSENFIAVYSLTLIVFHSISIVISNLPRYLFVVIYSDWKSFLSIILKFHLFHRILSPQVRFISLPFFFN